MNPSKLNSVDLEDVRERVFLTSFQVMLMLWPKDHTLRTAPDFMPLKEGRHGTEKTEGPPEKCATSGLPWEGHPPTHRPFIPRPPLSGHQLRPAQKLVDPSSEGGLISWSGHQGGMYFSGWLKTIISVPKKLLATLESRWEVTWGGLLGGPGRGLYYLFQEHRQLPNLSTQPPPHPWGLPPFTPPTISGGQGFTRRLQGSAKIWGPGPAPRERPRMDHPAQKPGTRQIPPRNQA